MSQVLAEKIELMSTWELKSTMEHLQSCTMSQSFSCECGFWSGTLIPRCIEFTEELELFHCVTLQSHIHIISLYDTCYDKKKFTNVQESEIQLFPGLFSTIWLTFYWGLSTLGFELCECIFARSIYVMINKLISSEIMCAGGKCSQAVQCAIPDHVRE